MGRIPQTEIDRLKQVVPIQRLAAARGIKLRPHGALIRRCLQHLRKGGNESAVEPQFASLVLRDEGLIDAELLGDFRLVHAPPQA